jgi:hypothetical protein
MTTIASFFSIGSSGKKTLSMISDSKISWESPTKFTYDYSQKIFHLNNSLDIFGYCGDSLFCLINISQIVSYLNNSTAFANTQSIQIKQNMIFKLLDDSIMNYPSEMITQDFTIYWNTLTSGEFYSHGFKYFKKRGILKDLKNKSPKDIGWIFYGGSGGKYYFKALENLNYRSNHFSRIYFKALIDVIESEIDWKTGGPPQMTTIREDENDIISTSFIYKGRYYLHGTEDILLSNSNKIEYRDLDFNFYYKDVIRNNYTGSFVRNEESLIKWKENILNLEKVSS